MQLLSVNPTFNVSSVLQENCIKICLISFKSHGRILKWGKTSTGIELNGKVVTLNSQLRSSSDGQYKSLTKPQLPERIQQIHPHHFWLLSSTRCWFSLFKWPTPRVSGITLSVVYGSQTQDYFYGQGRHFKQSKRQLSKSASWWVGHRQPTALATNAETKQWLTVVHIQTLATVTVSISSLSDPQSQRMHHQPVTVAHQKLSTRTAAHSVYSSTIWASIITSVLSNVIYLNISLSEYPLAPMCSNE